MNRMTRMAPILVCMLTLSGCLPSADRPTHTREVTWAKMGTPARIVDDRSVKVLVPDGQGGWLPGKSALTGMVALDEPTLEYYRSLDAQQKETQR